MKRLCRRSQHAEATRIGPTGQRCDYRDRKDPEPKLLGTYQDHNAAVALDTVDVLRRRHGWDIPEATIRRGLSTVSWPGRFEVLQADPLVLVDGAHNPNGTEALVQCLRTYLPEKKLTFVMGVMADKDYSKMLDIITPLARNFIVVTPPSQRALTSGALKSQIEARFHLPVQDGASVAKGIRLALNQATQGSTICIFGSLYQVG